MVLNMALNVPKRVHISPVGFDLDRVTIPLIQMNADRVWLVKEKNEGNDDGLYYFKKILDELKESFSEDNIRVKNCDLINRDLFGTLRVYRDIIREESGNHVYINVSTGTKIHSIAGMLVCMIFKGEEDIIPYYVVPETYDGQDENGRKMTRGCKEVFNIPSYKIQRPSEELIRVLNIINIFDQDDFRLTKKLLIEELDRDKLLEVSGAQERSSQDKLSAKYRALDRKYVEPLLKWQFIEIIGTGRKKEIRITEGGRNILTFLG